MAIRPQTRQVMLYPASELGAFDIERALSNIGSGGQVKLLNNLLGTWRSAFRLSQNSIFAGVAREVTVALTPEPREVRSCGQPIDGLHLLETGLNPDLGAVTAIYGISGNSVISLPVKLVIGPAVKKGLQQCHLLVESARALPQSFRLVISGKNGVAVRKLSDNCQRLGFPEMVGKETGRCKFARLSWCAILQRCLVPASRPQSTCR